MQTLQLERPGTREEAGRRLAIKLDHHHFRNVVVLALPRGGVPVGAAVAAALEKPFDIILVRKVPAPGCADTSLGAITRGGVRMLNAALIDRLDLTELEISAAVLRESLALARCEKRFRGTHPPLEVADRGVILVDDGSSPCGTLRDAIRLLRRQHAEEVIVALPALSHSSACDLRLEADEVVILAERESTGKWFEHTPRPTDEEVRDLLS